MDWPSYWWGVATIPLTLPLLTLLYLVGLELFGRVSSQGRKCDWCDWRFAGLRENSASLGHVPREELHHPTYIHAHASRFWHRRIITRTQRHREAWTLWFDALPPGSDLHARYLPFTKRMGVKGRSYD